MSPYEGAVGISVCYSGPGLNPPIGFFPLDLDLRHSMQRTDEEKDFGRLSESSQAN